jgi:predicted nucleic acid-binding protein
VIVYFDTSAFVPLLVSEPSSPECRRLWDDADAVVSSRLLYVEAAAALAQAKRLHRLTPRTHRRARQLLDALWSQLEVAEVDQPLVEDAAQVAHRFGLRGYDAVHCASAQQLRSDDLVAATGERLLLRAWTRLGLATFDAAAVPP